MPPLVPPLLLLLHALMTLTALLLINAASFHRVMLQALQQFQQLLRTQE